MALKALLLTIFTACAAVAQEPVSAPFNMMVQVDEVEITLHANDSNGHSVNDLQARELKITDNGQPPRRIVSFEQLRDLPLRAGILIDTSSSMEASRPAIRSIASTFAERILEHLPEQKTDQAFVMSFNQRFQMRRAWTSDAVELKNAIQATGTYPSTTAIYDTIYAVCRQQFAPLPHDTSGNFIMLFSDGEDDASYLPLRSAVDMCQQTNTAIYVFRPDSAAVGLGNLAQLATLTGGRVFRTGASPLEIEEDLRIIRSNLSNQYRLVYKPATLARDGSFHQVLILPPDRVASVQVRSGYYAPSL